KVNVRIIAATNRDLKKEIESGNFREDLFYRIAVFEINLLPLRERLADIEDLSYFFLKKFEESANRKISSISNEYLELLMQHQWKGNIRELRNVIERSVILCEGTILTPESLPYEIQQLSKPGTKEKMLSAFELASAEKVHIQKVLNYTNGNKTKTAELLGIALTTLYRKMSEYNL
ncbi:MAG TPA: helix-turn-helix domain-containing protein, partial [Saprospiraceae bacterium]|nr:helix-turn-helix domain-containing protein [Saprospiraceae bacterium]